MAKYIILVKACVDSLSRGGAVRGTKKPIESPLGSWIHCLVDMTDSTTNVQPKALMPRKLEQQETLQTLNQWSSIFKNYYRRCPFYGTFLQPGLRWSNEINRGFTTTETSGLKRNPTVLAADLDSFLECLAGFLPFDYVAEKLKAETTNMKTVWAIIYEIYDAEISTNHYLDYAFMERLPQETYRNFFNRLVGFVRQHLPDTSVTAEGITSPAGGETLSIGLLDSIAIHWMMKIDRRLINIVKTEFAADLKNKRLCEMIKQIATNVDDLLARYSNVDTINKVSIKSVKSTSATNFPPAPDSDTIDMIVGRLERLESKRKVKNQFPRVSNYRRTSQNCVHCSFMNKQLGTNFNVKHDDG